MSELRERRKSLGLTQVQAAKACGVSRRTYQTYEEKEIFNETYDELIKKLDEIANFCEERYILNVGFIKSVCCKVFSEKYPEIECAYLFGSYARNKATSKSDVDLLVVCPPMGMKFYGIATDLEEMLHKKIDLHTHRQLLDNEEFLKEVLKDGIKIYGK